MSAQLYFCLLLLHVLTLLSLNISECSHLLLSPGYSLATDIKTSKQLSVADTKSQGDKHTTEQISVYIKDASIKTESVSISNRTVNQAALDVPKLEASEAVGTRSTTEAVCSSSTERKSPHWNLFGIPGDGYYILAQIGTPPQNVNLLVDTGSSNLAVAASNNSELDTYFRPNRSETFKPLKNTKLKVSYTQSWWQGSLGSDVVLLPGLSCSLQTRTYVALITQSHGFYVAGSHWQGILGLAFPELAQPNKSVQPWFDSLLSSHNGSLRQTLLNQTQMTIITDTRAAAEQLDATTSDTTAVKLQTTHSVPAAIKINNAGSEEGAIDVDAANSAAFVPNTTLTAAQLYRTKPVITEEAISAATKRIATLKSFEGGMNQKFSSQSGTSEISSFDAANGDVSSYETGLNSAPYSNQTRSAKDDVFRTNIVISNVKRNTSSIPSAIIETSVFVQDQVTNNELEQRNNLSLLQPTVTRVRLVSNGRFSISRNYDFREVNSKENSGKSIINSTTVISSSISNSSISGYSRTLRSGGQELLFESENIEVFNQSNLVEYTTVQTDTRRKQVNHRDSALASGVSFEGDKDLDWNIKDTVNLSEIISSSSGQLEKSSGIKAFNEITEAGDENAALVEIREKDVRNYGKVILNVNRVKTMGNRTVSKKSMGGEKDVVNHRNESRMTTALRGTTFFPVDYIDDGVNALVNRSNTYDSNSNNENNNLNNAINNEKTTEHATDNNDTTLSARSDTTVNKLGTSYNRAANSSDRGNDAPRPSESNGGMGSSRSNSTTTILSNSFGVELCGPWWSSPHHDRHVGRIMIGESVEGCGEGRWFEAPILQPWFYEVAVTGMAVDERPLDLPCTLYNTHASIVDSGTTKLKLPHKVLEAVVGELEAVAEQRLTEPLPVNFWRGDGQVCWTQAHTAWSVLPSLSIQIAISNTSSFTIILGPRSYLRPVVTLPVPVVALTGDASPALRRSSGVLQSAHTEQSNTRQLTRTFNYQHGGIFVSNERRDFIANEGSLLNESNPDVTEGIKSNENSRSLSKDSVASAVLREGRSIDLNADAHNETNDGEDNHILLPKNNFDAEFNLKDVTNVDQKKQSVMTEAVSSVSALHALPAQRTLPSVVRKAHREIPCWTSGIETSNMGTVLVWLSLTS